ncbi:hypothetical protein ACHWQZ_G017317 [Mnemiopsis leidyi]
MKSLEQEGWILKPDISKTHTELLDTDLSHVGAKFIPADFASTTLLTGPKILQVKRVKDVSHSKISHENGSNKSMFRLTLSDGNSTCSAMNLQTIPGLSGKVYPGTKLRIKSGGAQVLGGFLLLTPGNCEILGGRVEKLVENIEKNENISKKKGGEGGPPKFVPFGSAGNNNSASLNSVLSKPSNLDTEDSNSRNDGKNDNSDQKSSYQRDRGGKGRGKGGQRNDHRGSNDGDDHRSNDDRFNNKSRGKKSDSRGKSRGIYQDSNHGNKSDFRGSSRGNSHDSNHGNKSDSRGNSRGNFHDSNYGNKPDFRGNSRGNFHDKNRGNTRERDEENKSDRGRGSRGKDRSRRDDYSPPERSHPTGFSLGDMVQDFPALGSSAAADSATGRSTDTDYSSNSWGGGSRSDRSHSNEDRNSRSRGRGKGSRGRGNNRSRRDDYSSGQNKPAGFKADLEADFPALGGAAPVEESSKSTAPVSKSKGYTQVDEDGFEIHDHLLYDDNGPPRQLHDPSFHHKQGYDSYRAGAADQIVDKVRDMSVSSSSHRNHGNHDQSGGHDNSGGGGKDKGSKSQDYRRRDQDRGDDRGHRREGGESSQGRRDQRDDRGYDRRGDERYDQRYHGYDQGYEQRYNGHRYEQRYNDRYEQRYEDRYEPRERYYEQYHDHYDDRHNYQNRGGRNAPSDRSNLSGNRGRSSGHYRRY